MNIKLNITDEQIEEAKRITKEFDKIKTYDKFKCNTNYRGLLGEMVLNQYFEDNKFESRSEKYVPTTPHNIKWVDFNKPGWNEPDFITEEELTVDLKTSVCDKMYYNKIQHDIYVYAQISNDDKVLNIKGFITGESLERAKTDRRATLSIDKFNRKVYTLDPVHMFNPYGLIPYLRRDSASWTRNMTLSPVTKKKQDIQVKQ